MPLHRRELAKVERRRPAGNFLAQSRKVNFTIINFFIVRS
jgi:hypothetical protein